MDVPGIVRERLGDERRMTSVNVGGDDRVYVTPPRTLVYHASGLFSRESITEYPHDAQRFDVSADRREATFAFEYDEGVEAFSVPRERIETVLPPVLAGVLRSTGRIDEDESVEESYRFGERTLVVTDRALLTSVGEAVWDRDNDRYAYADVTDLALEDGLRIELGGESRRIDLPGDDQREAYETVEAALCAYHGVGSVDELPRTDRQDRAKPDETAGEAEEAVGTDDATPESNVIRSAEGGARRADAGADDFGDIGEAETEPRDAVTSTPSSPAPGGEPVDQPIREATDSGFEPAQVSTTEPDAEDSDATVPSAVEPAPTDRTDADRRVEEWAPREPEETAASPDEPAGTDVAEELDALRETVEHQAELLERNQELLERLLDRPAAERVSDDR